MYRIEQNKNHLDQGGKLNVTSEVRNRYIASLRSADKGSFEKLYDFLGIGCHWISSGTPKGARPFRGLKTKRQSLDYTPRIKNNPLRIQTNTIHPLIHQ